MAYIKVKILDIDGKPPLKNKTLNMLIFEKLQIVYWYAIWTE